MTKQEYREKGRYLWQNYVPKRGQAETVQGELIRALGKLWDESHRNGNINWDTGHEILAKYIEDTLINSGIFNTDDINQIKEDIARVLDYEKPYLKNDLYERLECKIVDWCMVNIDLIPHEHNHELHR